MTRKNRENETDGNNVDAKSEVDTPDDLQLTTTISISERLSGRGQALFVIVVCLAQFWTQFSLSMLLGILHIVGDSFGITNPGVLSWLIAGYSLTVGTFILVTGRFGDVFGYKLMLIIGFMWFSIWSLVAGVAVYSNSVLFIFARVLGGIGPSIMLPQGLALLGSAYPPGPRKAMAFSFFAASAPTGAVIGLVVGALFGQLSWWPWTFFLIAICLFCSAILAYFAIPNDFQKLPKRTSLKSTISELDLLGALLGVIALVVFNFAWNQAPVVGWQEPYTYVCLIIGVLAFSAFLWYERHIAQHPLLPLEYLSVEVVGVLLCLACGWACFGIWWYYTIQFFEIIKGATPLQVGAWASPIGITGVIAAFLSGKLLGILRPPVVMTIALIAFTVGVILMGTAPVEQTYWAQIFVSICVQPFGMDMSFPASTLIVSNALPKKKQGVGASLVNTIVNYSISIGLGIAGTVEVHVNNGGTTPADVLKGYRGAFYVSIGFGALGLFISALYSGKSYLDSARRLPRKHSDDV